jgi:hypothetical protein
VTDPSGLGSTDWANLSYSLTLLWIFFPLVITFAFSMMIAHAFIPSAVQTGHLPQKISMLRLPITVFGLVALAGAVILMILVVLQAPGTLRGIWGNFWI